MMRGTSTGTMTRTLVFWAMFALYLAAPFIRQHNFEFGDMIRVARGIKKAPLLTHWAIYVGKGKVEGLNRKNDNEDIFHITGPVLPKLSDCVFGEMGTTNYNKSNYLDKDENGNGYEVKSREYMIEKINELHHNCSAWCPKNHNCEHVATSIRYGFEHCQQTGTIAGMVCNFKSNKPADMGKRSLIDPFGDDSSLAAAGA